MLNTAKQPESWAQRPNGPTAQRLNGGIIYQLHYYQKLKLAAIISGWVLMEHIQS